MKTYIIAFGLIVWAAAINAQTPAPAVVPPKNPNPTLQERYYQLKVSAETYQDYKVIKEFTLDGMWKVAMDSLSAKKKALQESRAEVTKINNELAANKNTLKQKEDSVQEIVFASTHINFLGIDFGKSVFITLICIVVIGLVALVGFLSTRLKLMANDISGSKNSVNEIAREFEDYKKKAMEKQSKLSRELQTERNKLQEIKGSR